MENFNFYAPTYFAFGKDRENDCGELVKRFGGSKVLIHFGGGSVVRSGLLDRVKASLTKAGISFPLRLTKIYDDLMSYVGDRTEGYIFLSDSNFNQGEKMSIKALKIEEALLESDYPKYNHDFLKMPRTLKRSSLLSHWLLFQKYFEHVCLKVFVLHYSLLVQTQLSVVRLIYLLGNT